MKTRKSLLKTKSKRNSYNFETFREAKLEAERLSFRARARIETLVPQLKSLGLTTDMQVMDVGSGTGIRSIEIAKYLKRGSLLGIDNSDKLLDIARSHQAECGVKNAEFKKIDIYSRDLPSARFDLIYVRLVIQHLPDPVKAMKNLFRALKKGGILFLEETDRDWMMTYPTVPEWEETYSAVKSIQRKNGGDPNSGRKLGSYLSRAGFKKIEIKMIPVCGGKAEVQRWLTYYAPTFFNNLDLKKAARGCEVLKKISKLNQAEAVFFFQIWFQAYGIK
jgi:ubiquinone/menaquinone biosynthesis C-methylase UbiE